MNVARTTTIVLVLALIAILPVLLPGTFASSPARSLATRLAGGAVALAMPGAAIVFCWRRLAARREPNGRAVLLLLLVLAALGTYVHVIWVDRGTYPGGSEANIEWQRYIHDAAVRLDPGGIPHSYRFLPNAVTRLVEWLSGSYTYARDLYRFTFTLLLLLATHELARRHVGPAASALVLALYGSFYPVTIWFYAGQLADPMSHLSFLVAFLALERGIFPYFVLAVALGVLAKESVAAMLGYYLLFHRGEPRFWTKLAAATAVTVALVVAVRAWVVGPGFEYADVSEVGLAHLARNLAGWRLWLPQLIFAVGVLVPLAAMGWRRAHRSLKRLTLFLFAALFVSSALFSWLHEVRNFVPVVLPLAVIAAGALDGSARRENEGD